MSPLAARRRGVSGRSGRLLSLGATAAAAAACCSAAAALLCAVRGAGPRARAAQPAGGQAFAGWPLRAKLSRGGCRSVDVSMAADAEAEGPDSSRINDNRPMYPPDDPEDQVNQASAAVMRAAREGFLRQSVRLNLNLIPTPVRMEDGEDITVWTRTLKWSLMEKNLDMMQDFTRKLWYGKDCVEVKTMNLDEACSMYLYRQAGNPAMDSAVAFMMSRECVTSQQIVNGVSEFGDRLFVMANPEDSQASWRIEPSAFDFVPGTEKEIGKKMVDIFKEETYYYYVTNRNIWKTIIFRAYPYPWEVWIEDLNYKLVKIGESETKPTYAEQDEMQKQYDLDNNVTVLKKVAKSLKDNKESVTW